MTAITLKRDPTTLPFSPERQIRLRQLIDREIERLSRTVSGTIAPDFHRGGDELDLTSLRQSHEAAQAIRARYGTQLGEWRRAKRLLRDDPEAYATCEICGEDIPWSRLEILPTTRCCGRC